MSLHPHRADETDLPRRSGLATSVVPLHPNSALPWRVGTARYLGPEPLIARSTMLWS